MKHTVNTKKFSLTQIFEAAAAIVRSSPAVKRLGTFSHDGHESHGIDLAELTATIDSLALSTADLTVIDEEQDDGIDLNEVSASVSEFYISMDELDELNAAAAEDDEGLDVASLTGEIDSIRISLVSNSAEDAGQFLMGVVNMPLSGKSVIAMIQPHGKCMPSFTTVIFRDELNAILESADTNILLPHTRHKGQRVILFSGSNAMSVFNASIKHQHALFDNEMWVACGQRCQLTGIDTLGSLDAVHHGGADGDRSWKLRNTKGYLLHKSLIKEYEKGRLKFIDGKADVSPPLFENKDFNWSAIHGRQINKVDSNDTNTWPLFHDEYLMEQYAEENVEYFNISNGLDESTEKSSKAPIKS